MFNINRGMSRDEISSLLRDGADRVLPEMKMAITRQDLVDEVMRLATKKVGLK
jgi:hypothetical protein